MHLDQYPPKHDLRLRSLWTIPAVGMIVPTAFILLTFLWLVISSALGV